MMEIKLQWIIFHIWIIIYCLLVFKQVYLSYLTMNWGISVCVSVCVCVCVCMCLCVCLSVRLYVSTFLNRFSPNLEETLYGSCHVRWAIYCVSARNARACVLCAREYVHSNIFERIHFKFAGNILQITISSKGYVLFFIFTLRAHT
jgi:hypothetical protein